MRILPILLAATLMGATHAKDISQEPVVVTSSWTVVDGRPVACALMSDHTIRVLELNGTVTKATVSGIPLPATISQDLISPISETKGPTTYIWSWRDSKTGEEWKVEQDCRSLTVSNCLKKFLRAVALIKTTLKIT